MRTAQRHAYEDPEWSGTANTFEQARVRILTTAITQNPSCFDAVTRATAAVPPDGPGDGAEGEWDVALCALPEPGTANAPLPSEAGPGLRRGTKGGKEVEGGERGDTRGRGWC